MTSPDRWDAAPVLGARFEWIRHLGRGGHGRVELAYDHTRKQEVALKLLDATSSGAAALKREFRWLRDVVHPHLVAMLELVIEPELECLVLEYVDGVHLLEHLGASGGAAPITATQTIEAVPLRARAGELEGRSPSNVIDASRATASVQGSGEPRAAAPDRLAFAFLQLVDALRFLEGQGLVHGDLKPENILVERDRVVVLDFGIARLEDTREERAIGTLPWMAPEQLERGALLTGATDRYAVGALLHRVLSGFLPFVGTPQQVRTAKLGRAPRLGDGPLEALAHTLMSPDPASRPDLATMQRVFEDELERLGASSSRAPTGSGLHPRSTARATRSSTIVGRTSELAELASAVDHRRLAVLIGSPGLGKTTLLDRFCLDRAASVLRSRCYANESIRWNAIDGLVDALLAEGVRPGADLRSEMDALGQLFPALREPGSVPVELPAVELVRRAARGLGALVKRSTRDVLVVDDVQWADADSMSLLVEALRARPELGLVVAMRGPDARSAAIVARLATTGREVVQIELGPLGEEDAGELARSLDVEAAVVQGELVARATGGVPFLIAELAWAARRRGSGPRSVEDAVSLLSMRLAEIDPASRRLLSLLAINEAPLESSVLVSAAGEVAQKTIRQLVSERFCRVEQELGSKLERLDVFHDFIRRGLLSTMTASGRREAHAALAETILREHPARSDDIARHLFGAEDPRAPRFALVAADDARAVFAFDRAATWLRRVLETALDPPEARSVRRQLAECRRLAEDHFEAAQELETLARSEDARAAIDTRRQAAEQWLTAGELDRGLAILESLYVEGNLDGVGLARQPIVRLLLQRAKVRLLGTKGLASARSSAMPTEALARRADLAWTVAGSFMLTDPIRSSAVHAVGIQDALRTGDKERMLRALVAETMYSGLFGTLTRRRTDALLTEIEKLADALDSHARGLVIVTRSNAEILRGNLLAGLSATRSGLDLLVNHRKTVGWELMATRHFYVHALYYLGRFSELVSHVESEYREAGARRNRHRTSDVSLHQTTVGWLLSRGPEVARERAASAKEFWSSIGPNLQEYYALVSAITIHLWQGDSERAWKTLVRGAPLALKAPVFVAEGLRVDALHTVARTAIAHFSRSGSRRAATLGLAATSMLGLERTPYAAPLAMLQLAGLSAALGSANIAKRLAARGATWMREQQLAGYAEVAESYADTGRATHALGAPLARVLAPGLTPPP